MLWETIFQMISETIANANRAFSTRLLDNEQEESMAEVTLKFGRVPKPKMEKMICSKPYDGAGFTRLLQPRNLVGVCDHCTDGHGSIEFYRSFFGTGGERQYDA